MRTQSDALNTAREPARLAALASYRVMDTLPEAAFDEITRLAAQTCQTPMALITLLDEKRQWFKACIGLSVNETPREHAFCRYALGRSDLLVIPDTRQDPRFEDNPFVTGKPYIRFYAGAPLVTPDGYVLGTLCVLDVVPREINHAQAAILETLGRQVVAQLELRRSQGDLEQTSAELEKISAELARISAAHRRAEALLSSHLNFSSTVMRNVAEGIYSLDRDGQVTFLNPAAERMLGWTEAELRGRKIHDIIHHQHPDGSCYPWEDCPLLEVLRSGTVLQGQEDVLIRRDGMAFPVLCSSAPILEAGQVNGLVLSFSDDTERQRAEQERRRASDVLEASEERYRSLFETMTSGVIYQDAAGVFTGANPAAERLLGLRLDQIHGRSAVDPRWQAISEDGFPMSAEKHPSLLALRTGQPSKNVVIGIHNPTRGERRWLRVNSIPQFLPGETRPFQVYSLLDDITARKTAEEALLASNRRITDILESITDAFFALDQYWCFAYVNDQASRLLRRPREELLGQNVWEQFPEVRGTAFERLSHQATQEHVTVSYEEFYAPTGIWLSVHSYPSAEGLAVYFHDITARKDAEAKRTRAEQDLAASEQRLRLALDSGRLGTYQIDITTAQPLNASATCISQFGLPSGTILSTPDFFRNIHPDDSAWVLEAFQQAVVERKEYETEFRYVWPDGSLHWICVHGSPFFSGAEETPTLIGVTQDITSRKQLEAEKEQLLTEAIERADHDPLTGLLNHRAFHKRFREEENRARCDEVPLAVLMLDLDNFKFFNDAYGHQAGDDVLRQIAAAMRDVCRCCDVLARYGGDEFALLLPRTDMEEARTLKARLEQAVMELGYRPPGYDTLIPLHLSVGLAILPDDGLGRLDVLGVADARLQNTKAGMAEGFADQLRASLARSTEGFSMLDALVTAVDTKDRYTHCHSQDVLSYSLEIAHVLGLDEKTQHTIAVAALLHDVGKIGVPDHILRKPGKLTDDEFAAIQKHPMMGAAIVGAIRGFEETLDCVRHHHERWDGGGYPLGLRGEETPLLARLMAVADAFSAMTTDRPYRQGMDEARSLAILEAGAGTQWDPVCVRALIQARSRRVPVLCSADAE